MIQPTLDALVLAPADNVATALRNLLPGETIRLGTPHGPALLTVIEPVPFCHKLALRPITPGSVIIKYGESIGEATALIAIGAHVHVHNLRSRRAKRSRDRPS